MTPSRSCRALFAAAAWLVLPMVAVAAAPAATITTKKAIWGPVEVVGESQFPIYADLGVGIYQRELKWDEVAPNRPANPADPSDPAYQWPSELDVARSEAAKYGIKISLQVLFTPSWANGGNERRHAPANPEDYATFIAAAAKRYPDVRLWMVWGEPTRGDRFQPMGAKSREGPRLYARMLDAAYAALKSRSTANKVIGGNTFTVGVPGPIPFIKRLRLPNGRPPRMDLYGHNPFTARTPNLKGPRLGGGYADFDDLDELARVIDRNLGRKGQRHLKLFLSEYCAPTDHANNEFNFWVSQSTQAKWLAKAMKITRSFKRIYTLGTFLRDDHPNPRGDEVNRGLMTYDGRLKPSYAALRDG